MNIRWHSIVAKATAKRLHQPDTSRTGLDLDKRVLPLAPVELPYFVGEPVGESEQCRVSVRAHSVVLGWIPAAVRWGARLVKLVGELAGAGVRDNACGSHSNDGFE